MEKFDLTELDYLICAVIRMQTELAGRSPMMARFASAEHLANHQDRLKLGEELLAKLTKLEKDNE